MSHGYHEDLSLRSLSSSGTALSEGKGKKKANPWFFFHPGKKPFHRNQTTGPKQDSRPVIMGGSWAKTGWGLSCWKPISSSSDFLAPRGCNTLRISFAHSLRLMTVCTVTIGCYADRKPVTTMLGVLGAATYSPHGWQSCWENRKPLEHVAKHPIRHQALRTHRCHARGGWRPAPWNSIKPHGGCLVPLSPPSLLLALAFFVCKLKRPPRLPPPHPRRGMCIWWDSTPKVRGNIYIFFYYQGLESKLLLKISVAKNKVQTTFTSFKPPPTHSLSDSRLGFSPHRSLLSIILILLYRKNNLLVVLDQGRDFLVLISFAHPPAAARMSVHPSFLLVRIISTVESAD